MTLCKEEFRRLEVVHGVSDELSCTHTERVVYGGSEGSTHRKDTNVPKRNLINLLQEKCARRCGAMMSTLFPGLTNRKLPGPALYCAFTLLCVESSGPP